MISGEKKFEFEYTIDKIDSFSFKSPTAQPCGLNLANMQPILLKLLPYITTSCLGIFCTAQQEDSVSFIFLSFSCCHAWAYFFYSQVGIDNGSLRPHMRSTPASHPQLTLSILPYWFCFSLSHGLIHPALTNSLTPSYVALVLLKWCDLFFYDLAITSQLPLSLHVRLA